MAKEGLAGFWAGLRANVARTFLVCAAEQVLPPLPIEEGTTPKGVKDFHLRNFSRQGHNLALTVLLVPNALDSGSRFLQCSSTEPTTSLDERALW